MNATPWPGWFYPRRMGKGHVRLWRAISILLFACGGTAPVVESRPPVEEPVVSEVEGEPEWAVRPLFRHGPAAIVTGSPGDALQLMVEGARVEVEGDELRWADSVSVDPIWCGTHVDGRYYFTSASGALYASDTFLGPLELLREGHFYLRSCLVRFGVHSVITGPGNLVLVGPGDRIAELPDSLSGRVVDAAFRSPTKGVVVVVPGDALFTKDLETFSPVDVGGRAVLESWPEEDRWVLVTDDGHFAIDEDGKAERLEGTFEPSFPRVPEDVEARLREASIARQPLAWTEAMPDRAGRLLLLRHDDERYGRPVDGAIQRWSADGLETVPAPEAIPRCFMGSWGSQPLWRCEGKASTWDGAWREIGEVGTVVAAHDGSSIATEGYCLPDGADERDRTICLYDGERWRHRTLEERWSLSDVLGEWVLLRSRRERRVISFADPTIDLRVELGEGLRVRSMGFDAEGGLWGRAGSDDGLVGFRGDPGEPVVPFALPEGTRELGMVDGRRGMAVGETLADVWVTRDGAETWEPLALPIQGEAANAPRRGHLRCGVSGCVLENAFVWGSPELLAAAASPGPMVVPPVREGEWPRWRTGRAEQTTVRCALEVRRDDAMAGYGYGDSSESTVGELSIEGQREEEPRLRWAFHAAGRSFEAESGRLPEAMARQLRNNLGNLLPLHLTPRLAIVDRCAIPMDSEEPDPPPVCGAPHVVRSGSVPEPLDLDLPEHVRAFFVGALPMPGGRLALRFAHEKEYQPSVEIVAVIDRDGRVERRRLYLFSQRGFARVLAVRGRDAGLAIGEPGTDGFAFHSVDRQREPVPLGVYPLGPLPVCRRSPGRTGTVALGDRWLLDAHLLLGEGRDGPAPGQYHEPIVALNGADSCLAGFAPRSPRPWTDEMIERPDPWVDIAIRRGTLQVRSVPAEGEAGDPVQCTLAAPE